MISRSNYVAITLIMCVILLMFQLTGVSENVLMNKGENIYAAEGVSDSQAADAWEEYEDMAAALEKTGEAHGFVGLVGNEEEKCLEIAKEWCINNKKTYSYYADLKEAAEDEEGAQFLIVNGKRLGSEEDIQALGNLAAQGRNVVISSLPDTEMLSEDADLRSCLGIAELREERISVDGFKLFGGLLIGGETVYKDYEQIMPYVVLDDSVTAYAVAQSEDSWIQELENEELPAVIWRYSPDVGKVYVVNGDYLEGQSGAGLLTGFAADSQEVYLYPVVNAQITVVENYPLLADENEEAMEEEYGQTSSIVFRDILWPSIVAIFYDTDDSMTVTASPRLDYSSNDELDTSLLQYYYEQVTKESGEMGISGYQVSDLSLDAKLEKDLELYEEILPNYEIRVFQSGDLEKEEYSSLVGPGNILEDVRTVLTDYEEDSPDGFFTYLNDEVLALPIYMNATKTEDPDDFRARSLVTAYGYYGTAADTSRVVYPKSEEDSWNIMSNDWAKNYRPYRVPFESFEKLTATQADLRVRNYLAMDYEMETQGDNVSIKVDSTGENSYFILRLHGEEISEMSGGSYEEIENGWYLLTVEESEAEILLEQTNRAVYYIEQ